MRLSIYLLPTLRENPTEAQVISHRLMLRAGMIRQHTAGIYSWLPLGLRVLRRIEQIVREEQDAIGAQEILMPTVQSAELWHESGRYEDYGREMLRFTDRHKHAMLYGPTHEEVVTDIFRQNIKSYRDLPKVLYQIHWKFRDEVRPRFGVMRCREFLMKDSYSFDFDYNGAQRSYNHMFVAYLRTFARMGLQVIPMRAQVGPIGGSMSHEFIVLASTGESGVFCHKELLSKKIPLYTEHVIDYQNLVREWTNLYAATDEQHDSESAEAKVLGDNLVAARGIEVGHIFHFGKKYSDPMKAVVIGPTGKPTTVEMGSYGIGVSRLVGAIIESFHDKDGIIWPESVAPFKVGLISLKSGNATIEDICWTLYEKLNHAGVDVLYDDRQEQSGVKFADMDLVGLPWQVIVGSQDIKKGVVTVKNRATGIRSEMSSEAVVNFFVSRERNVTSWR